MLSSQLWIAELDQALEQRTGSQRFTMLRRVTDLFLAGASTYTEGHVAVFDDVMTRLIEQIEREALIELSQRLAPIENAPSRVINRLSRDDDISVSGPVLEQSPVLTDRDLVEIARTKSQRHLSAIASRKSISEMVTDILVDLGNSEVAQKVTANEGARISRKGFDRVVDRAHHDEALVATVVNRKDLPPELFEKLVRNATETVRKRLLAKSPPEMQERITKVLALVAAKVVKASSGPKATIQPDRARLRLQILQCAKTGKAPEMLEAFAALCGVPTKVLSGLARQGVDEGFLVLGKANELAWTEIEDVLKLAMPGKMASNKDVKKLFDKFMALSTSNAQRAASFIRTSRAASRDDIVRLI
jgi:uncharacterized protein (DUF2336 family)